MEKGYKQEIKKNILMIGISISILNTFRYREDINIYAIEEEELYKNNKLSEYSNPILKKVVLGKYIESDECISIAKKLNEEIKIDGVMPARDYTVRAVAKIAETLNLPGIGVQNAQILTNKCLLREACEKYNIPHPRFKKINSIEELYEFYDDKPLIFKPATLQASLGISKITCKDDIKEAWNRTVNTIESYKNTVSRAINRENIVEEFVDGFEVSVETFVKDGQVVFSNITKKIIYDNNFVEKGHIVPANLSEDIRNRILNEKRNFVEKLQIKNGLLHSEWKVDEEKPVLIECAVRVPGDYIFELIDLSYGFNFLEEFSRLLVRDNLNIIQEPQKVSSIQYFTCKPGVLKEIVGIESLLIPEVVDWSIDKKIGEKIFQVESSWDRVGYFIISTTNYETLEELSKNIINSIEFVVE